MSEVGAYEAKTRLPALLERVQQGERFVITKHGRPVAELVPVARHDAEVMRLEIVRMRAYREQLRAQGVRLSDLLEEGQTLRDLAHTGHRY